MSPPPRVGAHGEEWDSGRVSGASSSRAVSRWRRSTPAEEVKERQHRDTTDGLSVTPKADGEVPLREGLGPGARGTALVVATIGAHRHATVIHHAGPRVGAGSASI
jgi:hypothetical protein